MATVGRNKAVADFKTVKIQGFLRVGVVAGGSSALYPGRSEQGLLCLLNWMWNYFNYNQSLTHDFLSQKGESRERA
jgi:NADH dehydrogenase